MKKSFLALIAVLLVVFLPLTAFSSSFKLIKFKIGSKLVFVDDEPILLDIAPFIKEGRTVIPLRFIGEQMGAENIKYDAETREITMELANLKDLQTENKELKERIAELEGNVPKPPKESGSGKSRDNPVSFGTSFLTKEGFQIKVKQLTKGKEAWDILEEANEYNDPPEDGMQYILITLSVKNISSKEEPSNISYTDFDYVGSSNKKIGNEFVVQPDDGIYQELEGNLYHGGKITGSVVFCVPKNDTKMMLIWSQSYLQEDMIYFEVK
jgi:hypothetical protein